MPRTTRTPRAKLMFTIAAMDSQQGEPVIAHVRATTPSQAVDKFLAHMREQSGDPDDEDSWSLGDVSAVFEGELWPLTPKREWNQRVADVR